ncbi:MAG: hypothetical protein M3044_10675 [Thermoproteota archaeon]|nr:hypothetical protein [Thermoproteota archaeon]
MEPKYYQPSASLVEYLHKELQSLRHDTGTPKGRENESQIYTRDKKQKKTRTALAKAKFDAVNRVFQSFADIIYFLEFIQDHQELQDLYEDDLKDLLGIHMDVTPRPSHFQYRGALFRRFLDACLFQHAETRAKLDLDFNRLVLYDIVQFAMRVMRRSLDPDEERVVSVHMDNVLAWAKNLAYRVRNTNNKKSRRMLGFNPYDPSSGI